jgi:beta-glucosidase
VSSAHAFLHEAPKRPRDFMDNAMADFLDWSNNEFFFHAVRTGEIVFPFRDMEYVPELKDSCDFWAVNFYNRHVIDARSAGGKARPFDFNRYRTVDADFYNCEFTPESFMVNLSRLNDKPIHITENGFCAEDDRFRIISLALNLSALHEAIKLYHLDVREYYYWSLMDNYEWQTFTPRFGLVHVDFKTFERVPKPSAGCYREIIANNGFDGSMIEKYVPELPKFTLYDNPDIHK